jgi:hypothetical protein
VAPSKGPPCPECGKVGCKSLDTFACWVRCHKRALDEHGYARCGSNTVMFRKAGVPLLLAPQPKGNEVWYGPGWAVRKLADLRKQATAIERRLYGLHVEQALRADPRYTPPPAAMLDRLDALRAFAILRGWRLTSGTWHK